eukprot:1156100-Pelagomonas_calceolata.AAC.10
MTNVTVLISTKNEARDQRRWGLCPKPSKQSEQAIKARIRDTGASALTPARNQSKESEALKPLQGHTGQSNLRETMTTAMTMPAPTGQHAHASQWQAWALPKPLPFQPPLSIHSNHVQYHQQLPVRAPIHFYLSLLLTNLVGYPTPHTMPNRSVSTSSALSMQKCSTTSSQNR